MTSYRRWGSGGGYRPEFDLGCEDLALYLRLAARFEYDVVPELVVACRRTPGVMSSQVETMSDRISRC